MHNIKAIKFLKVLNKSLINSDKHLLSFQTQWKILLSVVNTFKYVIKNISHLLYTNKNDYQ